MRTRLPSKIHGSRRIDGELSEIEHRDSGAIERSASSEPVRLSELNGELPF